MKLSIKSEIVEVELNSKTGTLKDITFTNILFQKNCLCSKMQDVEYLDKKVFTAISGRVFTVGCKRCGAKTCLI
jgi:hypothetical protein